MRRATFAIALALCAAAAAPLSAPAAERLVRKTSPHDVATTMDRLAAAIEAAGASVAIRIDHAAAAGRAGLTLRPTQVIVFGNPAIGTPMMEAGPSMALDLPLRVAAWEDADGTVHVVYRDIRAVAAEHGADAPTVAKAAGALEKLTDAAIAPE